MKKNIFAIGSYTQDLPHVPHASGEGVSLLTLDGETGQLNRINHPLPLPNPSYLHWNRESERLFAVSEDENSEGAVFELAMKNDSLSVTGQQRGPGKAGCFLTTDSSGSSLFAVSYLDGSLAAYPLQKGELSPSDYRYQYSGNGPDKLRQESSHAHHILMTEPNKFIYVCDLGSDTIWKHPLPLEGADAGIALKVPSGYGPRHIAGDPETNALYILCELKPKLLVAVRDRRTGDMMILQEYDTTGTDTAAPAAIKIHPSGRSLVVSNRFEDTVTVFRIIRDRKNSMISLIQSDIIGSGGKTPRDIEFNDSGRWLLIANQDSDSIQVLEFDSRSGLPLDTHPGDFKIGTPTCITGII